MRLDFQTQNNKAIEICQTKLLCFISVFLQASGMTKQAVITMSC